MKLQNKILAYMGALGMATLIAMLIAIRDRLVAIAPWVLGVLLAVCGLVLVYFLHKLYVSFRKDRLALQARVYEVEGQKQALRLENERWQIERASLLLGQHLQSARIFPDAKGYMPTLVQLTAEGYQFISFPHPAHQGRIAGQQQMLAQQAESLQDESDELPVNVRYEDIKHLVPRGHVLVGIGLAGVETKPQAVGACLWVVGLSGTGKTSTTVLRVEERKRAGHKFVGADPHWFKDDSLTNAIAAYHDDFLLPMAKTPEETLDVLNAFLAEFQARKSGQRSKPWQKVTLLVDEVGSLMDKATATTPAEKAIIELLPSIARICGQEARNFQMGGIFISQQATGLAWLRKVALMVIVHQLLQESEKKLATNNDRDVMEAMKTWPIGRTYIFGVGFQEGPRTVQQPIFSPGGYDAGEKILPDDEQMEGLRPNPLQSAQTALPITDYPDFEEDSDGEYGAFSGDFDAEKETDGKVLVFPENGASKLVERSDCKTDDGLKQVKEYRFTETEIIQFIAAYKAVGNIEKALSSMKKGSGYKPHARELIQAYGLRKDA